MCRCMLLTAMHELYRVVPYSMNPLPDPNLWSTRLAEWRGDQGIGEGTQDLMKTTEIAPYIATRNVRLYMGGVVPFLPLLPLVGSRTLSEIGWIAFGLVRMADPALATDGKTLHFCQKIGCFGVLPRGIEGFAAWKPVEFDGYGDLASWKEVGV